jgi:diguanylate cyclase (GGDEF)-like protein/PAS domain S-box-containing protein
VRPDLPIACKLIKIPFCQDIDDIMRRLFSRWMARLDLFLLLPAFALLLLAGLWSGVWYQLGLERQVVRHETLGKSQTLAFTFAEYSLHILQQIDHASQLFKLRYEAENGHLTLEHFARKAGGLNSALPTDTNAQWLLINASGQRVEASRPFEAGSVAQEAWFVNHASRASETLVVDKPFDIGGNGQKRWQIRFSRRLNRPDGSFAGVVAVEIDPTEFVDHFDSGDLGAEGVVLLHSPVEQLSIRRVGEQTLASSQLRISNMTATEGATERATEGAIEQRQLSPPFDNVYRLYAARPLAEFALEAVVGLSEQMALGKYQRHRNLYVGSALGISGLILGFTGLLMWQGRRLRDSMLQTRKNQAELTAANDASPLGLLGSDKKGRCTYVNRTFEEVAGISRSEALGEGWLAALHPDDRSKLFVALKRLIHTHEPYQNVFRFTHKDGKIIWASVKIAPILMDNHIEGYVGSVDDITLRREAELALQESEARLRTIADALPAMIAYLDADERYRFHNGAYAAHFGPGIAQAMGKTVREMVGETRYAFLRPYILRVLAGETLVYQEESWPDGVLHCLEAHYIPQFSVDGTQVVGFHVMRQDITAKKLEQIRLTQLAQVDALTGLCNRAGFQIRLADAMKHSRDSQTLMALMYLDIDRFKPVNDSHGHKVGDALLKAFAQRLAQVFRASDTVARLGGDEFTVLMENLHHPDDAKNLAGKVVAAMQAVFVLEALEILVSTSAGLAFYRGDAHSPESLMHEADMMLYQSKRNGRNQFQAAALPAMLMVPHGQAETPPPLRFE